MRWKYTQNAIGQTVTDQLYFAAVRSNLVINSAIGASRNLVKLICVIDRCQATPVEFRLAVRMSS